MRIVYHKDGTKSVIEGNSRKPSYDSTIDKPMEKQVMDAYRQLESEGKLKGPEATRRGASFIRSVWEN